nr:hypothetical protein [Tanacetum cinerariifolium]
MESLMSSQLNQPYSPINPTNLDMNFEKLFFSQDYNYSQYYSMGHGSGHGLAHGSAPVQDDEDDSPVEESKGFWDAVIRYFEKETGSSRGYDSIVSNWKNRVRPRIGAFCAIINNVEANHESDHPGWKDVEMLYFYKSQGRKKVKTSETTSGSTSDGLNLNEEANEDVEETQEFRPMGRDRAKAKNKAAGSSRGRSSSFVDLVADKFFNIKQKN